MGPILLLEKSTVQGLNPSEITSLWIYYSPVVCPMLMRELLSNLAKDVGDREETEKKLAALAAKVDMPGFYVTPEASFMAANNLLGVELPIDGRVPMPGGTRVRSKDGRHGVIFQEPQEKIVLRKWQARQFSDDERQLAKQIRSLDLDVDLQGIQQLLAKKVPRPSLFGSLKELVEWVDGKFFESISNRNHLLSAGSSVLSPEDLELMLARWEKSGKPAFRRFAPYAHYFYRCTIIYYLGLTLGFISSSKKAKTHLDIQYLFYLPFCMVFTSGDAFLRDMFPFFQRSDQMFLWKDDLKGDLQNIQKYWNGLSESEQKKVRKELGSHPPELTGSLTHEVWKQLMRPRTQVEDPPELTKEQNERLVEQIMGHYAGAIRIEDNKSMDASVFSKYETLSLSERSSLLLEKCLEVLGLNKGKTWADVKKEISSQHVRAIYDYYSDLWRPDTALGGLLAPDPNVFRGVYLGEVDPDTIVENVLGSLIYFDQIAVINPFINPWSMNETENPLNNPGQYEADLLKIVFLLILLSPWIDNGQLLLVPDPSDLNVKFKWDLLKIGEKEKLSMRFTSEEQKDFDRFERLQMEEQLRVWARLPEPSQRAMFKKRDPNLSEEEITALVQHLLKQRARDPIAVDRPFSGRGENMIFARSGAGCELSLILCQLLGAAPLSTLLVRMNQYRKLKRSGTNRWDELCKMFNERAFRYLNHVNYELVAHLKSQGCLAGFRAFFRKLTLRLSLSHEISDEEVSDLTSECGVVLQGLDREWQKIEGEISRIGDAAQRSEIRLGRLILDIEEGGYVSQEISSLWDNYVAEDRPLVRLAFHMPYD